MVSIAVPKAVAYPSEASESWLRLGMLSSQAQVTHLLSLGYAKTIGRSSYCKRQQCHQCLSANKPCIPIFGQNVILSKQGIRENTVIQPYPNKLTVIITEHDSNLIWKAEVDILPRKSQFLSLM
jgi:hypothetical protein